MNAIYLTVFAAQICIKSLKNIQETHDSFRFINDLGTAHGQPYTKQELLIEA